MNKPLLKKQATWKDGFLWMFLLACAIFLSVKVSSMELPLAYEDLSGSDFDNKVEYIESTPPPINSTYEIYDSSYLFFKGDKLASLTLKENTFSCGDNCLWEQNIENLVDSQLVEDTRFYRIIYEDDNITEKERYLSNIRSFNMYLVEYETKEVEDYQYQCKDTGEVTLNGTAIQECSDVLVGTKNETTETLIPYNYEILKAGNYTLRGVGTKKAEWTYDWQVKKNGVWTEEWSTWGVGIGSGILYYNPKSLGSHSGYSGIFGFQIKPNKNLTINQIIKGSGVTATRSFIINSSGGLINQSVFNGNIAITSNNLLEVGKIYYVGVDAGGSSFTDGGIAATGYPFYNETFNWSAGLDNYVLGNNPTGAIRTDSVYSITALNISVSIILSNITINSPLNNFYLNNSLVNFNITTDVVGGANATNITLYLNGIENETKIITGTTNTTIFTKNLSEGSYNQSYIACDTDGDCGNSSVYYFTIDYSAPTINVTSPTFENYLYQNKTLNLNYSITDATSNLSACWYIYNGVTKNLNCSLNTTTFNYSVGQNSIQVYANDSLGNTANVNQSWGYYVLENSVSYNKNTMEGSLESFYLNTSVSTLDITSAVFNYKNKTQVSQINSNGNYRIIFIEDFEIEAVTSQENATFYWEITLSNGIKFNTTSRNQTIDNVGIDECTSYTYKLINMTLYDEALKTPLNGTIELFYEIQNYPNYNTIQYYNKTYSGVTSKTLCSNVNFSGTSFVQSAEIKYYANDYEKELYYIQKGNMNHIVNLGLYDLKSNDSTNFLITYQNNKMVKVKEAVVQLLRKYISQDLYEVVEAPLTSSEGTAVLHIDLNTNIYKAVIVKDGVILDTFDNLVFSCESPLSTQCTQNLYGNINPSNSISIENLQDFSYSVSSLNDTVTVIFSIPSGMPSTVNLLLKQTDYFGNSTLCNKTVTSSGGSIQCTFLKTIGDSILNLYLYKDGDLISTESYVVPEENGLDFLNNNFFIVFIFILSLVGMAFSSPEWMIINSIITLLVAGSLWLLNGMNFVIGLGAIIWLVIAAAILINKLSQQEDR